MGGDHAPDVNIDGALLALADDPEIKIQLVGDRDLLLKKLGRLKQKESDRLQILHAEEVITMDDHASQGMRKKKKSSIHVGLQQVKEGKAHAFAVGQKTRRSSSDRHARASRRERVIVCES